VPGYDLACPSGQYVLFSLIRILLFGVHCSRLGSDARGLNGEGNDRELRLYQPTTTRIEMRLTTYETLG
jgi:hypothetical protein